jgi:pimeloyl-ACP methyl ester carboxylesterase
VTAPIVVLHEVGDERGGAPWRDALAAAGWRGPVVAPDLPGHAGTPPPPGGNYEIDDALLAVLPLLAALDAALPAPVVVGCGVNGWASQVLALAGRASAVVVVDGLGGPWSTPRQRIDGARDLLRAIADDPAAMAPAPPQGLDPRLRHRMAQHGSRRLASRAAAAMPVPALLVESAASPLASSADVDALAAEYRAGATVERVAAATAEAVAAVVVAWAVSGQAPPAAYADPVAG